MFDSSVFAQEQKDSLFIANPSTFTFLFVKPCTKIGRILFYTLLILHSNQTLFVLQQVLTIS